MKFCRNCGKELADYDLSCPHCSTPTGEGLNQTPTELVSRTSYAREESGGKGLAIASMACGIVGMFCIFPCSIVAVAMGASAKRRGCKSAMATAGIITGIAGLAEWAIYFFLVFVSAILNDFGYYI